MPTRSSARSAQALPLLRAAVRLLPVMVLVQAVIAGQALFGDWSIVAHGVLGNVTFTVAIAAHVLAIVAKHRPAIRWTAALAVLLTAQIGLGYTGRETLEAASWHVPLGVTIFGVTVHLATLGSRPPGGPAPGQT